MEKWQKQWGMGCLCLHSHFFLHKTIPSCSPLGPILISKMLYAAIIPGFSSPPSSQTFETASPNMFQTLQKAKWLVVCVLSLSVHYIALRIGGGIPLKTSCRRPWAGEFCCMHCLHVGLPIGTRTLWGQNPGLDRPLVWSRTLMKERKRCGAEIWWVENS